MPLQLIETNVKCPKEMIPFMKFFRCKYRSHGRQRSRKNPLASNIHASIIWLLSSTKKKSGSEPNIIDTSIYFNALAAMLRCLLPMSGIFMSL